MSIGLLEPQRQALIADRLAGKTIDQLCDIYRISDTSIRRILKKAGVKVGPRPRGKAR